MDATEYIHFFEKPTIAICKKCGHFCVYTNGLVCPNCRTRDYFMFESEDYKEGH